jgi:LmbE family N-acetylglucosaminyl deacetylase
MHDIHSIDELGTILGVWAHPDDETYLSGGLMAAAADNGQRIAVVSATAGEHGTDDPHTWPPERLARVRRWEAVAAMRVLGVDDHRWLGLGDGTLADHDPIDGAERIAKVLVDVDPDTIVTFGPDGITGHPDHRTISAWVDEAHRMTGSAARVLYATESESHAERFTPLYERLGMSMDGTSPPVTATRDLAVDIRLSGSALDRKLVALRAMATQTAPTVAAFGIEDYAAWVAQEAFVLSTQAVPGNRSRPPRGHGPR